MEPPELLVGVARGVEHQTDKRRKGPTVFEHGNLDISESQEILQKSWPEGAI